MLQNPTTLLVPIEKNKKVIIDLQIEYINSKCAPELGTSMITKYEVKDLINIGPYELNENLQYVPLLLFNQALTKLINNICSIIGNST